MHVGMMTKDENGTDKKSHNDMMMTAISLTLSHTYIDKYTHEYKNTCMSPSLIYTQDALGKRQETQMEN